MTRYRTVIDPATCLPRAFPRERSPERLVIPAAAGRWYRRWGLRGSGRTETVNDGAVSCGPSALGIS